MHIDDIEKFHIKTEDKEEILAVVHRHKIYGILIGVMSLFFLVIVPIFFLIFGWADVQEIGIGAEGIVIVVMSVYLLSISFFSFALWVDFYLDMGIITSKRIINIEQKGFFARKIAQLYLVNIQDVSGFQKGILANIFNYGDVTIQSAATVGKFNWVKIPDPFYISEWLLNLHKKSVKNAEMRRAMKIQKAMDSGNRERDALPKPPEHILPPGDTPEKDSSDEEPKKDDDSGGGSILK